MMTSIAWQLRVPRRAAPASAPRERLAVRAGGAGRDRALPRLSRPCGGRFACRRGGDQRAGGRRTRVRAPLPCRRVAARSRCSTGFIHAGSAWLEVPEVADWNGAPCWRLVARAESNSFFTRVYPVRNRIESLWDQAELLQLALLRGPARGRTTRPTTRSSSTRRRTRRATRTATTFAIPPGAQDALSSFYYTRFQALPIGGSITFDYHASRKSAPLEVRVLGRETVTHAGREVRLHRDRADPQGGRHLQEQRPARHLAHDDERRMPVLMKSKVLIGSISVVLQDVKTGA